jgi:phosphocarrier protein
LLEREVTIANRVGLHARPAAEFVRLAARYKCDVRLTKDGQTVNGKSIMGVMMLAAECGSRVVVTTEGADEEEAMKSLIGFLEKDTETQELDCSC